MDVCEEFLSILPIENELNHVKMDKDRAKMEQIDKDTTCALKNTRRKVEGERIEIRGFK